jgi:hypothetical protein
MRRASIVMATVAITGLASAAAIHHVLFAEPTPPLPPLLQHVAATGGNWTRVCFQDVTLTQPTPERDFNLRLEAGYPIGSSETRLRADLREAGFVEINVCAGESGVRAATFRQREGGLVGYAMVATVYWASDESQRLTWRKGYISFSGL